MRIIHQSSCINSPKQNDVGEWKNIHPLEISQAIFLEKYA